MGTAAGRKGTSRVKRRVQRLARATGLRLRLAVLAVVSTASLGAVLWVAGVAGPSWRLDASLKPDSDVDQCVDRHLQALASADPPGCEGWSASPDWGEVDFFATATANTVSECLSAGADVDVRVLGGTPLLMRARDVEVLTILVNAGADPNARSCSVARPCTALCMRKARTRLLRCSTWVRIQTFVTWMVGRHFIMRPSWAM